MKEENKDHEPWGRQPVLVPAEVCMLGLILRKSQRWRQQSLPLLNAESSKMSFEMESGVTGLEDQRFHHAHPGVVSYILVFFSCIFGLHMVMR